MALNRTGLGRFLKEDFQNGDINEINVKSLINNSLYLGSSDSESMVDYQTFKTFVEISGIEKSEVFKRMISITINSIENDLNHGVSSTSMDKEKDMFEDIVISFINDNRDECISGLKEVKTEIHFPSVSSPFSLEQRMHYLYDGGWGFDRLSNIINELSKEIQNDSNSNSKLDFLNIHGQEIINKMCNRG